MISTSLLNIIFIVYLCSYSQDRTTIIMAYCTILPKCFPCVLLWLSVLPRSDSSLGPSEVETSLGLSVASTEAAETTRTTEGVTISSVTTLAVVSTVSLTVATLALALTLALAAIAAVTTTVTTLVATVLVLVVAAIVAAVVSTVVSTVVSAIVVVVIAVVTVVSRCSGRRTSKSNSRSLNSKSRGDDSVTEQGIDSSLVLGSLIRGGVLVCLHRVGEVLDVLLNLGVDGLELLGSLDVLGSVGLLLGVGLLDGEAATEGTSKSVVAASDSADVSGGCWGLLVTGGLRWDLVLLTSEAVEVIRHLDGDVESLLLDLGETV